MFRNKTGKSKSAFELILHSSHKENMYSENSVTNVHYLASQQ